MHPKVSPLTIDEVEGIIRNIDLPANQDGPLYRLMFPLPATEDQQNEIIQWYEGGLETALQSDTDTFLKICDENGVPIGFCGWIMEDRTRTNRGPARSPQISAPELLDVSAWMDISRKLRSERERVINDLNSHYICRE